MILLWWKSHKLYQFSRKSNGWKALFKCFKMRHKRSCKKKEGTFKQLLQSSKTGRINKSNLLMINAMISLQPNKVKKDRPKNYSTRLKETKWRLYMKLTPCSVASFNCKKRRCSNYKWLIKSKRTIITNLLRCWKRSTTERWWKFDNGILNSLTRSSIRLNNLKIRIWRTRYAQMWNSLTCWKKMIMQSPASSLKKIDNVIS